MITRPSREQVLMECAEAWAARSTCSRLNVGAVFHRDSRILVQGYNGAPAGLAHCDHRCDCPREVFYSSVDPYVRLHWDKVRHREKCNSLRPCLRSVHAEQNGISFAARWGVGLEGASATITHQPCLSCAQSMINSGIVEVTYKHSYRLSDGLDLLEEAGIRVQRVI